MLLAFWKPVSLNTSNSCRNSSRNSSESSGFLVPQNKETMESG